MDLVFVYVCTQCVIHSVYKHTQNICSEQLLNLLKLDEHLSKLLCAFFLLQKKNIHPLSEIQDLNVSDAIMRTICTVCIAHKHI